jgi:molybdopterin synthase catalytic subunit
MGIRVQITDAPIASESFAKEDIAGCGAVVEFQGVVRPVEHGKPISGIDYECFREMAEHQLHILAEKHVAFREINDLLCIHRIGYVPAGETALYIRMASLHRTEVFQAMAEFILDVKRLVPIWKHVVKAGA